MDHTRRTALLSAAALCLVLGGLFWLAVREDTPVPAAAPAAVAASTDNWGLSFQTEGEPPVGNATAQSLAQYDAYYVGDTTQKVLYLTFDCGYENGYTAQILDVLKDHQASAAFFVVGHMIQSSPDLIRRMVQEGHIVGNHTFHHPDMSAISDQSKFQQELEELEQLRKSLSELLDRHTFGQRRLLRAFPQMRSIDHKQALERLRQRQKERQEKKGGSV